MELKRYTTSDIIKVIVTLVILDLVGRELFINLRTSLFISEQLYSTIRFVAGTL